MPDVLIPAPQCGASRDLTHVRMILAVPNLRPELLAWARDEEARLSAEVARQAKQARCRHCHLRVAARGRRGLCNGCHDTAEVREQYPPSCNRLREWPGRPTCQHCHDAPVCRPRGLCFRCYYSPRVKEQYQTYNPATRKFANRGIGHGNHRGGMPEPTDALPGSPEKVTVMEERARRRQQLFHPLDAQLDRGALRALVAA